MTTASTLNKEQEAAAEALRAFLLPSSKDQFFILSGYAGTGKTYLLSQVLSRTGKIAFTAPTNKAVKVLAESCRNAGWANPVCLTIHSLLGLKLSPDGAIKKLVLPDDAPKIPSFDIVVVDEASMIGKELLDYLIKSIRGVKTKVIFSGDPAQLPPVGELVSPIWGVHPPFPSSSLSEVMRHKNAILDYATKVRLMISHPAPRVTPISDFKEDEGIFVAKAPLLQLAKKCAEEFLSPSPPKVVAWRNIAVDKYNSTIREVLFENSHSQQFLPTDRVILTEPAMGTEEGIGLLASTDDEGVVLGVEKTERLGIPCYNLQILLDTNKKVELVVPTKNGMVEIRKRKDQLASSAKAGAIPWTMFWEFHESFHYVRHAYAITAHRSQGSTYRKVLVDIHDIMRNRSTKESIHCLYVAATRASKQLIFSSTPTVI